MAFVSKRELPAEVEKHLYEQLIDVFTVHEGAFDSGVLVRELFTPTERLMFAKRVAMVLLLEKGYSTYAIAQLLNVSDSTVARINVQRDRGRYKNIVKILNNRDRRRSVIGMLETLFTLGFPGVAQRKVKEQLRKDIEHWKAGG